MITTTFFGRLSRPYLIGVRASATSHQTVELFKQGITSRQFDTSSARSVGTVATTAYNRHSMKRWKKDEDLKIRPFKTPAKTNGLKGQLKVCDKIALEIPLIL